MYKRLAAGIAAAGLIFCAQIRAQQTEKPAEQIDELETVLVIGEQPGPGLWKVSKGDHVMWVLASYSPLPKGMTWRSKKVEERIAESQEVIYPGSVKMDYDIGFFRMFAVIPSAMKANDIPGDRTLKDVLPAETWEKWHVLHDKYLAHNDSVERTRPSFAIRRLREAAYSQHKLSDGPAIGAIVRDAAKKHKVKIRTLPNATREIKLKGVDDILKKAREIDLPDLECFTTSLDRVESDIEQLKLRANAWARGNVGELRTLHTQPGVGSECGGVLSLALSSDDSEEAARIRKIRDDLRRLNAEASAELATEWVAAAEAALQKNRSTFAILPIREVVSANGYIARLRAAGYQVEEP
jgi:hypothetical protein